VSARRAAPGDVLLETWDRQGDADAAVSTWAALIARLSLRDVYRVYWAPVRLPAREGRYRRVLGVYLAKLGDAAPDAADALTLRAAVALIARQRAEGTDPGMPRPGAAAAPE
jgi:hypothetical protein